MSPAAGAFDDMPPGVEDIAAGMLVELPAGIDAELSGGVIPDVVAPGVVDIVESGAGVVIVPCGIVESGAAAGGWVVSVAGACIDGSPAAGIEPPAGGCVVSCANAGIDRVAARATAIRADFMGLLPYFIHRTDMRGPEIATRNLRIGRTKRMKESSRFQPEPPNGRTRTPSPAPDCRRRLGAPLPKRTISF